MCTLILVRADIARDDIFWLNEIDLDPDRHWRYMGTRALGQRPWLVVDSQREAELRLKATLLADRHGEVFAAEAGTWEAGREVFDLVVGSGLVDEDSANMEAAGFNSSNPELHPLDAAGRLIQEDLCLLCRRDTGWILVAGSVCFPSRWRLLEKVGRPLLDIHESVDGYASNLARRVDSLFDRIDEQIVWRRNWFVHPDPRLFQPDRPDNGDRVVAASECLTDLYLRSERQTLRRLQRSGFELFTIRTQQSPLARLVDDESRRSDFSQFLRQAPSSVVTHRGISEHQRRELRLTLG